MMHQLLHYVKRNIWCTVIQIHETTNHKRECQPWGTGLPLGCTAVHLHSLRPLIVFGHIRAHTAKVTRADHVSHIVLCIELAETSYVIRRNYPVFLQSLPTLFNAYVSPSLQLTWRIARNNQLRNAIKKYEDEIDFGVELSLLNKEKKNRPLRHKARWPHGWCARLRIGWSGFEPQPRTLCCVIGRETSLSQCLYPRRGING